MLGYKNTILKNLKCDNGYKPYEYDNQADIISITTDDYQNFSRTIELFNDIILDISKTDDIIGIEILDAKDKFDIPEKGKMFIETYNDTIIFKEETKWDNQLKDIVDVLTIIEANLVHMVLER